MKLCYSVTINVSPYKKFVRNFVTTNFHALKLEKQQEFIMEITAELQNIIGGEWGANVWELTKKGDQHFHGTVVLDGPLTDADYKQINTVSAKYGSNQYNRCIDLQYCRDGGKHWREKYMQKHQDDFDNRSSSNSPEIRDNRTVPFSVFGTFTKGEQSRDDFLKPPKVRRDVFGHIIK